MLDGRYPSAEFAELRPRIVWDRVAGTIRPRKGARQLAVTNAGTIPDRGLFAVTLPDGRRVGELDEEMVYEARPGQTFLLGASSWRIEEIGRDRVIVTPAPGVPGAVPFWRGDSVGRPKELGEAIGAFSRWAVDQDVATLVREHDLDELAAQNLLDYLREQQDATRVLPSDTTVVIERFRDEIGDWRLCVLTPFGGRVHAAWSLALSARIRDELGLEADAIWSDDGIIVHLPDADEPPGADLVLIDPDELEDRVVAELRLQRAVRRALPRERQPVPADPAGVPGQAHAAVAAAAEVAEPAGGRQALRAVPGDPGDLPRVPAGRPGPARPDRPAHEAAPSRAVARRGRHADRLAVRVLAALRLRRDVHVRGRHAERGAPRGRPVAGSRPPARAARPGRAARAHRPGRAADRRRRPPAPLRAHARRDARRARRRAAPRRRPHRRGGRRAHPRAGLGAGLAQRAGRRAARRAAAHRRRGALGRGRRRRPVPRRARRRAARRAAGGVPGRRPRRATRSSPRATPARTSRSRPRSCATATAST